MTLKFELIQYKEEMVHDCKCPDFEPLEEYEICNYLNRDYSIIYYCSKRAICKNFCSMCMKKIFKEEIK
jgi:hypothetical protein